MMKFVKGMVIGTMVSTGVLIMLVDTKYTRSRMLRKGRKMLKTFKNMY